MPKRPANQRRGRPETRLALDERLRQIQAEIAKLRRDRAAVKREQFSEMTESLRQLQKNTDDLAIQLKRIAQLQEEVDVVKRALKKAHLLD
jgi:septal ring factor EnvC (AmiA/AmiB activator)